MQSNPKLKEIRLARRALSQSSCTCGGKHDPFWVPCPRTMAEIDLDNALARAGFMVW